jgi:NFACT protein RNA binding domain
MLNLDVQSFAFLRAIKHGSIDVNGERKPASRFRCVSGIRTSKALLAPIGAQTPMMKTTKTLAVIFSVSSITASMFGRHFDTLKCCQAFVLKVSKQNCQRTPYPPFSVVTTRRSPVSSVSVDSILVSRYSCTATRIYSTSSSSSSSSSTTGANQQDASTTRKTLERQWNVTGLKKEVGRLILRSHKKIGKASERLRKTQEEEQLLDKNNNEPARTAVAAAPASFKDNKLGDFSSLSAEEQYEELEALRARLQDLNKLESALASYKQKSSTVLPEDIASLAIALDVDDAPPVRPDRGPPKPKGPRVSGPRLPYRRFYSQQKTEIRVGKTAADNDEVSTCAEHRNDWWMHASGCPGSHIIIRSGSTTPDDETIQDAAALAARHSKCQGSVIKVSLTRCRDVKKPPGAKPGLVLLTGSVQTVSVNMKTAEKRLERLDQSEIING